MAPALKIIRVFLSLLAGLAIAVGAVLYFIDFNEYRGVLAARLGEALGRPLRIEGDLKLRLGLHTGFSATGLSLGDGEGGSHGGMAKIGRVSFGLALWPLLNRDIEIDQLQIEDAEFLLERQPDGRLNWAFGQMEAEGDDESQWSLPRIEDFRLLRSRFIYRDGGEDIALTVDGLTIHVPSGAAAAEIDLKARLQGGPVTFKGRVDSLDGLLQDQEIQIDGALEGLESTATVRGRVFHPLQGGGVDIHVAVQTAQVQALLEAAGVEPVLRGKADIAFDLNDRDGPLAARDVKANLSPGPGVRAAITGQVGDALALTGLALDVTVQAEDAAQFSTFVGVDIPSLSPVQASGHLAGAVARPVLTGLVVRAGAGKRLLLTATGAIADPLGLKGLDLRFEVVGPGGAVLEDLLAWTLPITDTLAVKGRITGSAAVFQLDDLDLRLKDGDVQGKLGIDLRGDRPRITADLHSKYLDLDFFPENQDETETPPAQRLIPDLAIDMGALALLDGTLKFQAARLRWSGLVLETLHLTAGLQDGTLTVRPSTARLATGQLVLGGSLKPDGVNLQLDLRRASMAILGAMVDFTALEGNLDLSADLRARGTDLRGLAAGLNGKTSVVVSDGRVETPFLDLLAKDLALGLLKNASPETGTRLHCFANSHVIKDGVAVSQVLLLDTDNITVVGEGQTDLTSEAIRYHLVPRPKDPSLLSLATPINISGNLANPNYAPDSAAVAGSVATAVVGNLLLPGIGLLLPLLNQGTGEAHPCLDVVKDGQAVAAPAKAGKGKDAAGVLERVGGAVGEGAKKLLQLPGKILGSE